MFYSIFRVLADFCALAVLGHDYLGHQLLQNPERCIEEVKWQK